ncbi:MAG: hypothetical protein WC631_01865 [Candidatus Paceibacterota bacterium]|jgi:hypothetical protein
MISLEKAIEQIKSANPFMGDLLSCEEPLINYVKNKLTSYKPNAIHIERQKDYIGFIKNKIDRLFIKESVNINYAEGMILDTTDHHNILNYPSTIGAHLISRFDSMLNRRDFGDYYVLDCGNIPFSDVLHKRGVEFGGKHLNLYPKSTKNKLVSRYPIYKFDLMESVKNSENEFSEKEIDFIKHFQSIIDKIDFSTCERLSDQIVKVNYYLWLEFFDEKIRNDVRRCITLEHDEILIQFLSTFLLENKNNIVWKSLFDKGFRDRILSRFDGIYGAWNYSGKGSGTHFFWGFNLEDGKEYRMDFVDGKLVNHEGLVRDINMTPEDITLALTEGILIPSIFTKFALVSFYLGAKVMGGPGQTEYTDKLHKGWLDILKEYDYSEYLLVNTVTVLNFNCGDIAFHRKGQSDFIKEWGFDIAMNHTFSKEYLQTLGKTSFKYLLYPLIPISYYRLTPANERQEIDYKESDLYQGFNWLK